ncbi:hypothetical protein UXO16_00750 [Enterobacter hormaechei]
MITLTKEWLLKTIAELEEERDAVPGVVNEDAANALAAMRLALASLEAEPVAWLLSGGGAKNNVSFDSGNAYADPLREVTPLYTASPAPVSVPDDVSGPLAHAYKELTPTFMRNHIDVFERYGIYPDGSAGIQAMRIALDGMNRRAAMLQGAEPVTTAYKLPFEQWLSQQTGTIDVECGCVMTEVFFHWLRVAYEAGNSPVIPDGWVAVPVEPTKEMINSAMRDNETGEVAEIYELMLAAAPQQEVK